ncbi:hypothetical protein F2Q69_00020220 [Brassica cretica]|uniref:Uncharacterized protein n=1 Tax=Brassica cretica TaxID=69181 RepID=A0A8S9Q724_BRACR|nr:hypothetical protein F2Q69_00020220 [Brassica cretica]
MYVHGSSSSQHHSLVHRLRLCSRGGSNPVRFLLVLEALHGGGVVRGWWSRRLGYARGCFVFDPLEEKTARGGRDQTLGSDPGSGFTDLRRRCTVEWSRVVVGGFVLVSRRIASSFSESGESRSYLLARLPSICSDIASGALSTSFRGFELVFIGVAVSGTTGLSFWTVFDYPSSVLAEGARHWRLRVRVVCELGAFVVVLCKRPGRLSGLNNARLVDVGVLVLWRDCMFLWVDA